MPITIKICITHGFSNRIWFVNLTESPLAFTNGKHYVFKELVNASKTFSPQNHSHNVCSISGIFPFQLTVYKPVPIR